MAVKSGRTAAGHRAASSHTGALLAASDVTVDALFASAGVLRAETVGEMFDVAGCSRASRCLAANRVAVLTNAGGPGDPVRGRLRSRGVCGSSRSPTATRARLAEILPSEASTANPVDMIASATADQYERSLRILLEDDDIDAVVTIFVRPLAARAAEVARGIAAASDGRRPPRARRLARRRHAGGGGHRRIPRLLDARGGGPGARPRRPATRAAARRPADPPFEPADADIATAAHDRGRGARARRRLVAAG